MLVVALLIGLTLEALLRSMAPAFSAQKLEYTLWMCWAILPVLPLTGILISARSVYRRKRTLGVCSCHAGDHAHNAIRVALIGSSRWGVRSLAVSTTAATALQALSTLLAVRNLGFGSRWKMDLRSPAVLLATSRIVSLLALDVVMREAVFIDHLVAADLLQPASP